MKVNTWMLATPVLLLASGLSSGVAGAQGYQDYHNQNHQNFYNGVRDGGHNGQYYNQQRGDQAYYNNDPRYHQGGIGPGKGALIGGAGGAALGAVFGGGLKGSIIGGAAGAGIGAIAGKAHQNSERRNDGYYPR